MTFIPRTLGATLLQVAEQHPVVYLTGPRQSGKTTLAQRVPPGYRYLSLEQPRTHDEAASDPERFLRRGGAGGADRRGLEALRARFPTADTLLVGSGGTPLETYLGGTAQMEKATHDEPVSTTVSTTEPPLPASIAALYQLNDERLAEVLRLDRAEAVRIPGQKRAFDVGLAAAALLLLSPVFLLVLLAELLDALLAPADRGRPLYLETRVSRGRPFQLRKFRIMRAPAIRAIREEGMVPKVAENTPGNLTAVGVFLKKTGLDELPQFWSILVGEMSFVGPRPKPVAEYRVEIDAGIRRRAVIGAGLTGPAQLLKGTQRTVGDELLADLRYIERVRTAGGWRVLAGDLRLTGRTVLLMLKTTGE